MVKILVTGCCGFIGSNLIKQLFSDKVIGIDSDINKKRLEELE